jgi:hypothetical protein
VTQKAQTRAKLNKIMAHCKYCKQDIRLGGEPHRCAEGDAAGNGERNARRSAAACSPLRVAYSRAELADKLKDWMIELWGDSPKNLDPEQRDQWHRDNGLIYHFICDHFPAENAKEHTTPRNEA